MYESGLCVDNSRNKETLNNDSRTGENEPHGETLASEGTKSENRCINASNTNSTLKNNRTLVWTPSSKPRSKEALENGARTRDDGEPGRNETLDSEGISFNSNQYLYVNLHNINSSNGVSLNNNNSINIDYKLNKNNKTTNEGEDNKCNIKNRGKHNNINRLDNNINKTNSVSENHNNPINKKVIKISSYEL